MPEIKNTFLQGKMNKDLDERLIPKGQYRDAMNIEVSTSEGASAGVVKNILGNTRVDVNNTFPGIPEGFTCVGSIANEKTNKLYWFISSYAKDAIIEHDIVNDKINPVIVDKNAGNSKAVLKFSGNIITGINIINNLLFWTDNNSEPKKINIDECKKGTDDLDTHTQLVFENGSFNGITIELITKYGGSSSGDQYLDSGKYIRFEKNQMDKLLGFEYSQGDTANVRHYRNGKFLGLNELILGNDQTPSTGPGDGFGKGVYAAFTASTISGGNMDDWHVGDVIFGDNTKVDIEERHITVIKLKPLKAPTVKINHTQTLDSTSNIPNLFETTFPRFSYRYKYRDGEFSAFAPFTEPVFNPKYTKDINNTSVTNVFYTKDNVYDVKDPHNKAMVNSIHSVELTDFITVQTPEDAVEIEVLYKQENSSVIYSIDIIKQADPDWHKQSNHEGYNLGTRRSENGANYSAVGGYTKGKYIVTTENIYAALPANQLLRPWDNVPRKALGQEMTGNRIVYGNYLQNYNLGGIKPEIKVGYNDRKNQLGTFENKGLPSIKSQRNYQLGVVYCDKYGRETPVFTSKEGAINIPWQETNGTKNASKTLQLNASVVASFPEWVDSFKFFIKETSSPYYNLVMDQAWVAKSTYELDRGEHLWISFPSSDRNKISNEDYIILKKKIGAGEEQVAFENKFKVIDVQNEAPDSIRYELVNYAILKNKQLGTKYTFEKGNQFATPPGSVVGLFSDPIANARIDREVDTIILDVTHFDTWYQSSAKVYGQVPLEELKLQDYNPIAKDLYISWRILGGSSGVGSSSQKYKVTGGRKTTSNYLLKLSTQITKADADIAHETGDSTDTTFTAFNPNLIFQVEKKIEKDSEDFSGKFFVKISKNQITDLIEQGSTTDPLANYIVSSKTPTYYFQDDIGSTYNHTNANYGLTNYEGHSGNVSGANSIHDDANSGAIGGNNTAVNANFPNERKLSFDAAIWNGIKAEHGPTFFIDSMFMAAGQSEASNLAKYCCVTWSGADGGSQAGQNTGSAWTYSPLKVWLSDWVNSANVIENVPSSSTSAILGAASGFFDSLKGRFHDAITSGLIETSTFAASDDEFKVLNADASGAKVTGWVGNNQYVKRRKATEPNVNNDPESNHINGLEGIVTTSTNHSTGPRRWFSGITGSPTDYGVGVDTKTYSENGEIGRHFMHLSFFAPGKNLHSGFSANTIKLKGEDGIANRLQGIWGGGHFTLDSNTSVITFGAQGSTSQNILTSYGAHHSISMEGNNDINDNNRWIPEAPGPGVGYGYDLDYQELHERQWDPTFSDRVDPNNETRDFIKKLHAGSQFKFSIDPNENIYTIKKVVIKKLYNHTSWRNPFNNATLYSPNISYETDYPVSGDVDAILRSVEQTAIDWARYIDQNGGVDPNVSASDALFREQAMANKIVDFGRASNRRVCYIIELDKNPAQQNFNPLADVGNRMTADKLGNDFANIEFIEKVQSTLLAGLNKFPAIWEIDPKRQEVNLDIYYEASNNIPVKLNSKTNELLAPLGCRVDMIGSAPITSNLISWDGTTAVLKPGLPVGDDIVEIEYSGIPFKFTKEDGSFIILTSDEQQLLGQSVSSTEFKTSFVFRTSIGDKIPVGLAWHNCFSFGNGLESNRIRDDFNEMFIGNGVKASTTTQQIYEEEHRLNGLIYSGLYNSNSGVNDLNQFIMAEKITKDLNPTFGSIQKLFQRRISLIAFCEDKVVSITSNKDAIFNADGNPQLIASNKVLGDANPFVGEYGISKNPESFASESYRAYFTDKQRGAVIRLSKDGLTPISKNGMHDWFRDNLQNYSSLIGSYDSYKEDYNITLSHAFGENFIYNGYLDEGIELATQEGSLLNYINNPTPSGLSLVYSRTQYAGGALGGGFIWGPQNEGLDAIVDITMHPEIPAGSFQEEVVGGTVVATAAVANQYTTNIITSTGVTLSTFVTDSAFGSSPTTVNIGVGTYGGGGGGGIFSIGTDTSASSTADAGIILASSDDTPFAAATYSVSPGTDNGVWYDPDFVNVSGDLFGNYAVIGISIADTNCPSRIKRVVNGNTVYEDGSSLVDPWNAFSSYQNYINIFGTVIDRDPNVEKNIFYPAYTSQTIRPRYISQSITRNAGGEQGADEAIVFDRPNPTNSYVEFFAIGDSHSVTGPVIHNSLSAYNTNAPANEQHNSFFNGDEIHVQFELLVYKTIDGITFTTGGPPKLPYGYNYIIPTIELFDGATPLASTGQIQVIPNLPADAHLQSNNATSVFSMYQYQQTVPGSFNMVSTNINHDNDKYMSDSPFTCIKQGMQPGGVAFPDTGGGSSLFPDVFSNGLNPKGPMQTNDTNNSGGKIIICGASFKFIDPSQQQSNGLPLISGADISSVKVIEDLVVRIQNSKPAGGSSYAPNSQYMAPEIYNPTAIDQPIFGQQLWEIKNLKIVKGFGITAPSVAFDSGILQADVAAVTTSAVTSQTFTGQAVTYDPAQPNIPANDIPAWVEVSSQQFGSGNNWYMTALAGTSLGATYLSSQSTGSTYGPDFTGTPISTIVAPGGQYLIPENYNTSPNLGNPNISYNDSTLSSYITSTAPGFPSTPTQITLTDNELHVEQSSGELFSLSWDISTATGSATPWENLKWYLVDVEYKDPTVNTNVGSGGSDGMIVVINTTNPNLGLVLGDEIDANTTGVYGPNGNCTLVQVNRTEYGSDRPVLRALFQIQNNSDIYNSNIAGIPVSDFKLVFMNFINPADITKVIVKEMSTLTTTTGTGEVTSGNWNHSSDVMVHSFSRRSLYYKNNGLCYDIEPGSSGTHFWKQSLPSSTIVSTPAGYKLKFTVGYNPDYPTEDFLGSLSVVCVNDGFLPDGTQINAIEGAVIDGIQDHGEYEIDFNFNGDDFINANLPFSVVRRDIGSGAAFQDYSSTTSVSLNAVTSGGGFGTSAEIKFYITGSPSTYSGPIFRLGISDVSLIDNTLIFQGGSSGSWNWSGFNPSLNAFVSWDNEGAKIQFGVYGDADGDGDVDYTDATYTGIGCPFSDPSATGVAITPITANQWVNRTINRYETYNVEFTHNIVDGEVDIYYFNSEGFGFRIPNISIGNPLTPATSSFTVVIGLDQNDTGNIYSEKRSSVHPVGQLYSPELQETFVVAPVFGSGSVRGSIDNMSMTRVFNVELADDGVTPIFDEKTITYSEDVNGWTSFKSFVPESGVSLSKKYFTFDKGYLFKHYVPLAWALDSETDQYAWQKSNLKDAENYNIFYDNYTVVENKITLNPDGTSASKIKFVLNEEPSLVKMFNTLNYEGTQAYIKKPSTGPTGEEGKYINVNNALAWSNNADVQGWACEEIKTDLDAGTLLEFIKKESKWFNYIKGKSTGDNLNTNLFSTQGIGVVETIT